MSVAMHPGELEIPVATVRRLVDEQFPQWVARPIRAVSSTGTVNALFRIGERLVGRFPLQPLEVDEARRWLVEEADAARELHRRTRFETPEPVAIGEPGPGYPLPWSVQTWIPGTPAFDDDPGDPHQGRARRSEHLLDVPRLRRLWADLRELPRTSPDAMTHGDLTPGNVLVDAGRLSGVIDVGGLGPADPALDLVAAWHLLETGPRQVLRDALGSDDLEWARGRAWAFEQAMGVVWYYARTNPAMHRMGRTTLRRILNEDS